MRITNNNFTLLDAASSKKPFYVVELSWDKNDTDITYLTSDKRVEVPYGATSVFQNVINGIGSTSQKIDPIKALSSIGVLNFSVINEGITEILNAKIKEGIITGSFTFLGNTITTTEDISSLVNKARLDVLDTTSNNGTYNVLSVTTNTITVAESLTAETATATLDAAQDSLRRRRVRIYLGYEGLVWDDYVLIRTQLIDNISTVDNRYEFSCSDIQRSQRKNIFTLRETTLASSIKEPISSALLSVGTIGSITIPGSLNTFIVGDKVYVSGFIDADNNGFREVSVVTPSSTGTVLAFTDGLGVVTAASVRVTITPAVVKVIDPSQFEMLEHGSSYSDLPNTTVGYARIDDMIFSYTGITKTGGTKSFDNCILGSLNTIAKAITVESGEVASEVAVTEVVYLQMPIVKLQYAILTGNLLGVQPTLAQKLPSTWHLGISTSDVSIGHFQAIGLDLWDITDDSLGMQCRFVGLKEGDGKAFIEKELSLLSGTFMPVLSTGALALKKMKIIQATAPTVYTLDTSNVVSYSAFKDDMQQVYNNVELKWNYDTDLGDFTRTLPFIDDTSITIHGKTPKLSIAFKGLHGYSGTDVDATNRVVNALDRYAGPPQLITLNCLPSTNVLEVGDIVHVDLPTISDYNNNSLTLDRAFEVQSISIDWKTGKAAISLFGSTLRPRFYSLSTLTTDLAASYYTSDGLDVSTLGTFTLISAGNGKLTSYSFLGSDLLTDTAAIYYYVGNLELINCTLNKNVQLRVSGTLTYSGTINGIGNGTPGKVAAGITYSTGGLYNAIDNLGGIGGVGNTNPQGSLYADTYSSAFKFRGGSVKRTQGDDDRVELPTISTQSTNAMQLTNLVNNSTGITGIPTNLQGTSGAVGGYFDTWYSAKRTIEGDRIPLTLIPLPNSTSRSRSRFTIDGGDGGNGGAGLLVVCKGIVHNGLIDLSGNQGSPGLSVQPGDSVGEPSPLTYYSGAGAGGAGGGMVVLIDGDSLLIPDFKTSNFRSQVGNSLVTDPTKSSTKLPALSIDQWESNNLGYPVPPVSTPVQDVSRFPPLPLSVTVQQIPSSQNLGIQAAGYQIVNIQIDIVPPTGTTNYSYAEIEYAINGVKQNATYTAANSAVIALPANGASVDIYAYPISSRGVRSSEFETAYITLDLITAATLAAPNSIVTNTDLGGANAGVILSNAGISSYEVGNTTPLMVVDATTGKTTLLGDQDQPLLESGQLSIIVPTVSGLQTVNGTETEVGLFEFVGKDVQLQWREVASSVVELTDDSVGDEHLADWWLLGYRVIIKDHLGNIVKEEFTKDHHFTYSFNENFHSGLHRSVIIEVYAESIYKNISGIAASIIAVNPLVGDPTQLSITGGYEQINISFVAPTDSDYKDCEIYVSETQGFIPSADTLVLTTGALYVDTNINYTTNGNRLVQNTKYYAKLRLFDHFDRATYNELVEYTASTTAAPIDRFNGISPWAKRIDIADREWIDSVLGSESISSTRIENITAAKITSGIINVTVGIEVEGTISVAGVGNDRLMLGPHSVNSITRVLSFGDGSNTEANYALFLNADGSASFNGSLTVGAEASLNVLNMVNAPAVAGADVTSTVLTTKGIADGADVTSTVLTTKGIADGADVTQTIIDGGLITTGGIDLGGSNAYIRAGQTAYNTGIGFWLGKVGGSPKFSIGDGTNYLKWDTTDGLLISGNIELTNSNAYIKAGQTDYNTGTGFWLGRVGLVPKFSIGDGSNLGLVYDGTNVSLLKKSKILGTVSYYNDSTFLWVIPATLSAAGVFEETGGTGVSTTKLEYLSGSFSAKATWDGATTGLTKVSGSIHYSSYITPTWDKPRRVKFIFGVNILGAGGAVYAGFGKNNIVSGDITNAAGIWIKVLDSGTVQVYWTKKTDAIYSASGGVATISPTDGVDHLLEIDYSGASGAAYIYLDSVLIYTIDAAEISTPTGTDLSTVFFNYAAESPGDSGEQSIIYIHDVKFLQDD